MIPTEPIGSLPRPPELIDAVAQGDSDDPRFEPPYEAAIRDTIERFEATGSPVITTRDTAFAKIRARVAGTALASEAVGAT